MMHHLPDAVRTVVAFVLVLGILVFVHEMGHYLVARWRGVHVEAFSIGFGRALVRWTDRVGTEWKIGWLPLGGYVKLHGQERPESVADEIRAVWQTGRTFHEKGVGSRAMVVAAGPVANFALAIVLFSVLFATAGQQIPLPVIGDVVAGGAAAQAGLRGGDRILAIDGMPTGKFDDVQRIVSAHPDQTMPFQISRDGKPQSVPVRIGSVQNSGAAVGRLGIHNGSEFESRRLGPPQAVRAGMVQTWDITRDTLTGLWEMVTGRRSTDDIGGPLRIAEISGRVSKLGFATMMSFIAVLSINLGLINLFPIPMLDGGHLLFYAVEAVWGRPVPPRAQEYGFRAGFALLAALMIFATCNDLLHLGVFHWVARQLG